MDSSNSRQGLSAMMTNSIEDEYTLPPDDQEFEKQTDEDLKIRMTPLPIKQGEHPLECFYTLWYSRRLAPSRMRNLSYDDLVKAVISFQSVEQFWQVSLQTMAPSQIPHSSSYHVFKSGIRPLWEDPANRRGGKWFVRVRRNYVDKCWENLLLALLGEQFMVGDEITGVVIANRPHQSVISVWTRSSTNEGLKNRIHDVMRRVMQIPPNIQIEYRAHVDSLGNTDSGGGGNGNSSSGNNNGTNSQSNQSGMRNHGGGHHNQYHNSQYQHPIASSDFARGVDFTGSS